MLQIAALSGLARMSEQESSSTVTVRIDAELVRKARIVCAHTQGRGAKQLKIVDYLDSIVRARIEADYQRVIASLTAGSGEQGEQPESN